MHSASPKMAPRVQPGLRYLHAGHFAFMRAVIQGLDSRDNWNRYLRVEGEHSDLRQVRRTISWIRDVFAAAARRHGRPGTARLVLMELSAVNQAGPGQPNLAAFIHAENLENFSESEQLQFYQERYAASARSRSRQARLLARQLDALNWLQQTIAQSPQPGDPIANWIHPGLASHLARAGLHRLNDLMTHMDRFGARWWRQIDAIGAAKAARIARWMAIHPTLVGLPATSVHNTPTSDTVAPTENFPRQLSNAARHAFVPLDALKLPPEITRHFALRAPAATCRIAATDDLSAIRAWLGAKASVPLASDTLHGWASLGSLSHTQRAYWKEAERFVLWLMLERRLGLSSVSAQDCVLYRDFLASPPAAWCAPRGRGKWHPRWRPFEGPLSPSARRFALTVIRGMYRYLVNQRYLTADPWQTLGVPLAPTVARRRRRFDDRGWQAIDRALAGLPATSANQRLALAIELISTTGLRVGQLVQCRVEDLCPALGGVRWSLRWAQPGGAGRDLPLPQSLADALCGHLRHRGLDADPQALANRGAYLLGMAADANVRAPWAPCARQPFDPAAGISAGTLRDQIKHFFQRCKAQVAATEPLLAAQFEAASSESLRPGRCGTGCTSSAGISAATCDNEAISGSAKTNVGY